MNLFNYDLIYIILKICYTFKKTKKHYLVLEMTIFSLDNYFFFIIFFDINLIITTYEIDYVKYSVLSNQ